jgi:hypothetical protein
VTFRATIEIAPFDDRHCDNGHYPFDGGCSWCGFGVCECQSFRLPNNEMPELEDDGDPGSDNSWSLRHDACLAAEKADKEMATSGTRPSGV